MAARRDEAGTGLSPQQRRFVVVLGVPAFGIALAYTVVSTYLPVLLERLSGPAITGVLLAAEGLVGLAVPVLVGRWSDRLHTRVGGRLPFILAGAALAVPALVLMPLLAGSLAGVAVVLGVFLVGYFTYFAPYYALYPDLVPAAIRGRSQGVQGGLRAAGLLLGLVSGGLLLNLGQSWPFLVGAAAIVVVTAILAVGIRPQLGQGEGTSTARGNPFAALVALLRDDRDLRTWTVANALWEAALAALRTFVVLYLVRGLGFSLTGASGVLALVGLVALVAAPVSGRLADRFGARRVIVVGVWVFALGALTPVATTSTLALLAVVPVAFAAIMFLTLPYTLLLELVGESGDHAVAASLFSASRAVGVLVGPLLGGLAIELLADTPLLALDDTRGYAAVFGVTSLLLLASIPVLRRLGRGSGERGDVPG